MIFIIMTFKPTRFDDLGLYDKIKNKIYIQHIKNFRKERKQTRKEYIEVLKDKSTLPEDIIRHVISFIPIAAKKPITNGELCEHILKEYTIAYRIKHPV